ncbi:Sushi, von Willebrand factor type A, EGF and pentraxin domain-containing protein 1 [Araneus ventricosus]|uniref:Sushi, von Willebrand factor type A, EGF and pentraxin domain-containing protein 1 n=1 Tax=Araneus ventricosus TaxID=182803 RepID=A0A4Y2LX67_ARAVE|nr:Sushi, von Willebrand factor type A, EGF and pentraxin domain-containing protein 1 [Araneus ventricosus]
MAEEEATCLQTLEWSPLPDCRYRRQCQSQTLPDRVRFVDPTCRSSNSLRCRVGCSVPSNSTRLVAIRYAECMRWGEWRGLPRCRNATALSRDGSFKKQQRCVKDNERRRGKCLRHTSANRCEGHPITVRGRCSRSRTHKRETRLCLPLPRKFKPSGTCSRMVGSTCTLQCRNGHLEGNSTAFCFLTGEWSEFPACSEGNATCPRRVSPFLSFVSDCSFAEGAKCQVRCRKDYALVGLHVISCENESWKFVPKCFPEVLSPYKALKVRCSFPPHLHGSLKVVGSCSPEGGMSCDVGCRDESARLTGPNATTCLPPGYWTDTTACDGGEPFCPEPSLAKYLESTENCSGKTAGSECLVRCQARPNIYSVMICKDDLKWSAPPKCTCPAPTLKAGMELAGTCKNKQPNESCSIKCKRRFSMVGKGAIICNDKLRWTSMAFCSKVICAKPEVGSLLVFKGDCMSKSPGDSCRLECKKGGKMLGHSEIRCIDAKHWTKPPDCACPPPLLDAGLKTNHSCKEILPGQKCFLSCKGNSSTANKRYITCQSDLVWSNAPTCEQRSCPKPKLSEALTLVEDCSSKGPNESCRVDCRGNGSILRHNNIVCMNGTHWSSLPLCSCPVPTLASFLTPKGDCTSKLPGQHCSLTCKGHRKLVGDAFIRCQKNMTWTEEPRCKIAHCVKKKLPPFLLYVGDCSAASPGEKCFLKCKEGGVLIGPKFIACKKGTLWTSLPICSCPLPSTSGDLSTIEDCSQKTAGEKCHLKCRKHFSLLGENFIRCRGNRRWSALPKCKKLFCSELKLPKTLAYEEDCSSKSPGDHCPVTCKEGGEMIGHKRVACVDERKWAALPKCACPHPKLGGDLATAEDCSGKLPGQRCSLKCRGHRVNYGKSYISCGNDTQWSPPPVCEVVHCLPPKLPEVLSHASDCSAKSPGQSCLLRCRERGQLIGANKITCINKTRWTPFPTCTCAVPHLEEGLSTTEPCNRKTVGEKCHVTCKNSLLLIGKHFITCLKNTRWSPAPTCRKLVCLKPRIRNDLDFLEDCSSKTVGEKCELKCKEETVARSMHISCTHAKGALSWTHPPHCACPKPMLSEGLHASEDCSRKMPGDVCKVACSENLTLVGKDFITCENGGKWSLLPKCS